VKQFQSRCLLVVALLSIVAASQGWAAAGTVRSGGAIQLGSVTYRLDGVDVPPIDQLCINEHADVWTCGIEARDQLAKMIAGKQVRCDDLGADPAYRKRRIGVCRVEGETTSLGQLLIGMGFALNAVTSAARFKTDEARAREARQGMWKGCFVAPREFRIGRTDGVLLGAACSPERDREIRKALFPEHAAMPPGCNIKGKYAVRARVTGNRGIYHLQACRSYPGLTEPDRWFCSEEDAQADGFRRAYNCRANSKGK